MKNLKDIIQYSTKLRLLYVEDDEQARNSTLAILQEFFTDITTAIDGQDAVDKYTDLKYDLIITDINMPRLNGLEFIKKVRLQNLEIPILVFSAHNESNFFIESIKLGVEGYLLKPLDVNQFLQTLYKIVEKLKLKYDAARSFLLQQQYQFITDKSSIVSKTDADGIITYVNDEFCRSSLYNKSELVGSNHNIIRHPDNPKSLYKELWKCVKDEKEMWHGVIRNLAKNGQAYYTKSTISPILDPEENIIEYIALTSDISSIMSPKKQLFDLIHTAKDALLVLIRIDGYNNIQKFYGEKGTDVIERKFARKLSDAMPKEINFDKIFILGNGEYAFAEDLTKENDSIEDIVSKIKIFQESINNNTVNIDNLDYDLNIIISLAYGSNVLENCKHGLKELLNSNHEFIFANDIAGQEQDIAKKNLQTLLMIKTAIENFKIISHFQPIIDNKTKQVVKYESLIRLENEDGKVLAPFFFLDVAKQAKYYSQLTLIILENSFNALKITDKIITINISALDIEKKSVRDKIFELLNIYKVDANRIVFELLEDEEMKDFDLVKSFIKDVKKLGVKIAIDDFGAGYSNFERLSEFQPDILKIDGSLIKNIETDKYSYSVVKTLVEFAKSQNIETVGEFVENEAIYTILKDLGVNYSQGYYFGKPDVLK